MTKTFLIGGASMPRTGHHFLQRILKSYFDETMGYCSYYSTIDLDTFQDCCRNLPCTKYRDSGLKVFFQKSHDFNLTDPIDAADFNIVQIREPIARVFSNFELHVRGNPQNNSLSGFRQFAQREYYYYVAFWAKWITSKPTKTAVVCYEDLKDESFNAVAGVLQAMEWDVDADKLNAAIAAQQSTRGGKARYVPKDVRRNPFYEKNWAEEYVANLQRACSGYDDYFGRKVGLAETADQKS